jgi:16S rRNA (guanine527-N7)-methyltransferase
MQEKDFETLLRACFAQNGLESLCQDSLIVSRFFRFATQLIETNRVMNLTALREMEDIVPLHFADCALCFSHIPANSAVLDVGCGGGFPSVPLAILRPDVTVTALDSTAKKTVFVAQVAQDLGLSNLQTYAGRAEEWASAEAKDGKREQFDVVISRAVARLPVLSELCLPFVKKNGRFIAMKGAEADVELLEAKRAIATLGGGTPDLHTYVLNTGRQEEQRGVIIVQKQKNTPVSYPRPYAKIKKAPL